MLAKQKLMARMQKVSNTEARYQSGVVRSDWERPRCWQSGTSQDAAKEAKAASPELFYAKQCFKPSKKLLCLEAHLGNYYPSFPRRVHGSTSDQRCERKVYMPTEDLCVGVEYRDNMTD